MENKEKKNLPANQIMITVGPNAYEVKFPNNGQLIDIETRKIQMTSGTHKDLLYATTPAAQQAFLLVEAMATFSVLIPQMAKDLNAQLMELTPMQSKDIVNEYSKTFYPWFKEWMDIINESVKDES